MDRAQLARLRSQPVSVPADTVTTALDTLCRKLKALDTPRHSTAGIRAKRIARAEAVRWLNRLDETDCPDELWPQFEAWLEARPENQEMVLAVEHMRLTLEELSVWCPPEGSDGAKQLLQLSHNEKPRRDSGVRAITQWVLIASPLAISAVALWLVIS